jgi:hypothetical protein
MTVKDVLDLASLLIAVASYVPYVRSIFVANTKPHAFTWLVWGTVMAIAFFAQLSDMAGAGSWATGLSAAFCLGIGVLALFRGEKHITRGDWIAFLATFLAIPLWGCGTRRGTGFQVCFDGHQVFAEPAGARAFHGRDERLPARQHFHGSRHRHHVAVAACRIAAKMNGVL